jgi:hypothetical protein
MNALLEALDIFNSKESGIVKQMECNFGRYDGHIVIMGSGGSHKILGNFAPTTKLSKNDACVEIGFGQSRNNPINTRLDQMACTNSVLAVFLNEKYYHESEVIHHATHMTQTNQTLRFLGY